MIDLRSDTVTLQPEAMKQAMFSAEVGDDVYGDDPTVTALELRMADLLGKEAGLFVPSGTFGNQLAIMAHTKRGDEVIIGDGFHVLAHEAGGASVLSGVQMRTIPMDNNMLSPVLVERMIRTEDIHYPDTGLIGMENALGNGSVMSLENMQAIYNLAKQNRLPVHLDGARLFNAATALNVPAKTLADCADTVNVCLSKGLCAPVGSVLVGSKSFIGKAKRMRKLMGGGLRQAGFLAAAGLYALDHMVERLEEDHRMAKYMADQLETIEHLNVLRDRLDINMVFFTLPESEILETALVEGLLEKGIKVNGTEDGEYRFVTHWGVTQADIDTTVAAMKVLIERFKTAEGKHV